MRGPEGLRFGTSGLRGLVAELTPEVVAGYIRAFLRGCEIGRGLYVGRDLRGSSPAIAEAVVAAARGFGVDVWDCGALPTPALALAAMQAGAAAVMVTGSHIPADRNGLKFYLPRGEITKADEARISAAFGGATRSAALGQLRVETGALPAYLERVVSAYGAQALAG